jgi:hypothetical protein
VVLRLVYMNEEQDYSFSSNLIITSKYTLLSFLPLFLFASFNPKKKMANVYFLLLAIFQVSTMDTQSITPWERGIYNYIYIT